MSGFSVFPKFCSFSVPNIPTVRGFVHFCAVFQFLPNFRTVFTEIPSGFLVPGTPLTPPSLEGVPKSNILSVRKQL